MGSFILPLASTTTHETQLVWFDKGLIYSFYMTDFTLEVWLKCATEVMTDLLSGLRLGPDKALFLGVAHLSHPAKVL